MSRARHKLVIVTKRNETMNTKLKYGTGGLLLGATLVAILALTIVSLSLSNPTAVIITEENKPSGHVCVLVWRNGELIYEYETHNIFVTTGSTWVKDFLKSGTAGATNATDDIAIGTHGTPSASDQKLDNELTTSGLDRKDASAGVTNINDTAYKVEYTWTATGSATVNATSLHHDPTDDTSGNAVAIANINEVSLIADDQLKVTWTLNVPSGS